MILPLQTNRKNVEPTASNLNPMVFSKCVCVLVTTVVCQSVGQDSLRDPSSLRMVVYVRLRVHADPHGSLQAVCVCDSGDRLVSSCCLGRKEPVCMCSSSTGGACP